MTRALALACLVLLAACGRGELRPGVSDVTGAMPTLAFTMTRANDNAGVTAADYRGKAVVLYFGFTNCPDECPATLANLARVLTTLGPRAKDVRVSQERGVTVAQLALLKMEPRIDEADA